MIVRVQKMYARDHTLEGIARQSPHLVTPIGQRLVHPLDHIPRIQYGNIEHILSVDDLPQGYPSAPLGISLGLAETIMHTMCNERGTHAHMWQGAPIFSSMTSH